MLVTLGEEAQITDKQVVVIGEYLVCISQHLPETKQKPVSVT
jgi:hypothetical protein